MYHFISEKKKKKKRLYNLVAERTGKIQKLHNSVNFQNLMDHFKSPTKNIAFSDFIDAEIKIK